MIDDDNVEVTPLDHFPASGISPYSNSDLPFQILANSALDVFPAGKIAPGTMVGNTDTRHYANLTQHIFRWFNNILLSRVNGSDRFSPAFLTRNDTDRFHGYNERISVDNLVQVRRAARRGGQQTGVVQVVQFYHRVIINAGLALNLDLGNEEGMKG